MKYVIPKYQEINRLWEQNERYQKVNLKSNMVRNILEDNQILENILNYRSFINEVNMLLILELQQFNILHFSKVEARIKLQNSIEDELIRYFQGEQQDKVPIIKSMDEVIVKGHKYGVTE